MDYKESTVPTMDQNIVNIGVLLLAFVDFSVGVNCGPRHEVLPVGRSCKKSCVSDKDCRSKKKTCQCDGICGRSCIKHNQRCPQLLNIDHGTVTVIPDYQFGAVAQYRCQEGYVLRGETARVCQGDEQWSAKEPQCFIDRTYETTECSEAPLVNNARHDKDPTQAVFAIGTMLEYKCLPGFTMMRDGVQRAWCVVGGFWVGPNMTCDNAGCPMLSDIENGWVTQDIATSIGSIATYECEKGYFLAGRAQRKCQPDGTWEGVQPSCETGNTLKFTCGSPPIVLKAQHDGDPDQARYPSGAQLLYTCDYGYIAEGNRRAMCSGEGQWIGLSLSCPPISCSVPGEISNGYRTGFIFTYPHKVIYTCHEGFELVGFNSRVCQADGRWSNELPICEPVTCPNLYAPVYGNMVGSGTAYGTLIRFECSEGYKNVGSDERRCQADRTWSGEDAVCEEINCGWPSPFYNGYLIGHHTTVGAIIFFSCNTRTTFDGPAFQTRCQENGEWSFPPPKCWGQCQVPVIPNGTLVGGRESVYVDHGVEIQYQCNNGLVPHEGSSLKCNNGTWSSTAKCVPSPCSSPPPQVHKGMRIFLGQKHGFRAKYKCFAGYKLTGMNSKYLTCNFGSWVGGRPHCEIVYCPSPGEIDHGQIYKKVKDGRFIFQPYISRIAHGDRLEYQCNDGYQLHGPGGATCVNGSWQPQLKSPGSRCLRAFHPPFPKFWTPVPNIIY